MHYKDDDIEQVTTEPNSSVFKVSNFTYYRIQLGSVTSHVPSRIVLRYVPWLSNFSNINSILKKIKQNLKMGNTYEKWIIYLFGH